MTKRSESRTRDIVERANDPEGILEAQLCETIESYDATVEEYYSNSLVFWPREPAERFRQGLSPGALILDVACGPGRDAKWFSGKGFRVVGLDRSSGMINKARSLAADCRFLVADVRSIPLRSGRFDGVWCSGALLHVPKRYILTALSELRRVAKLHALVYVSVKKGTGEQFVPDPRYEGVMKYWSLFEEPELRSLVEAAGFRIEELYSTRHLFGSGVEGTEWIVLFARSV